MTYTMRGTLRRGPTPDTIEGELRDEFGIVFVLTGVRDGSGYRIEGVPGPIADGLKLPWEQEG